MYQSLFVSVAERVPRRITRPPNIITIISLSKDMQHPTSYRTPMESRAPAEKLGKMCLRHASGDMDGRSKSQVWVDMTVSPFEMVTTRGLTVMHVFVCGVDSLP